MRRSSSERRRVCEARTAVDDHLKINSPIPFCDHHISGARPNRRCWPARLDLGWRWRSRLVVTAAEDRLEHLTTHSVAGIGEPPALACSQGLPGPSPEDLMGWPWA